MTVAAAATVAALLAMPGRAPAATTCDLGSGVLEVALSGDGDEVSLQPKLSGEIILGDEQHNPVTCTGGAPTVTNTNAISIHNLPGLEDHAVRIFLPSRLGPGANDVGENGGTPEIELFVNLNDAPSSVLRIFQDGQNLVFGADGINPNAEGEVAPDADIFPLDVPFLDGIGFEGPDLIRAAGGFGTGAPPAAPVELQGEAGADTLVGGEGGDFLEGGAGDDVLRAGGGDDRLLGGEGSDDLDGGDGSDSVNAGSNGTTEPERLAGGAGLDQLRPSGEDDVVLAGPGIDLVDYSAFLTTGVAVDLRDLPEAEQVAGTAFADVIRGDAGPDAIAGLGGNDLLDGGAGSDTLLGDAGEDSLQVRDGEADGVDCGEDADAVSADSPGVDVLSGCEAVSFAAAGGSGAGPGGGAGDPGGAGVGPGATGPSAAGAPAGGGSGGPDDRDRTSAKLGGYRLSPSSFAAAPRGRSVARFRKGVGSRAGTIVRYRLSEPATVGFTVKRAIGGRLRAVGSFRHAGRRGLNRFRFSGRLHGRKLSPGRYRLVARATDVAGNRSSPKRVRFEVLR